MKKLKISILLISAAVSLFSCKKELDDQFVNPEKSNPPVENLFQGMFTSALFGWKLYVQDYGEWYYQLNGSNGIPGYSQIAIRYITPRYAWFSDYDDLKNGNGFNDGGVRSYFNNFYLNTKNFGLMRTKLSTVTTAKAEPFMYYKLVSLIKNYGALKLIDLCNSIPYSEAWKGENGVLFPGYDDPKTVTLTILDELKNIADTLPVLYNQLSAIQKESFQKQDFAMKGDITKWVQYSHALRLRYALRISGVEEAVAKTHIQDVLTKGLPAADITPPEPFVADPLSGGTWERGWYENNFALFVPNNILKRMNFGTNAYEPAIDDPRLPVIAMPTKHQDYRGASMNADAQTGPYNAGEKYYPYADNINSALTQNALSIYNHATYSRNSFPLYFSTLAETDLQLAEIQLKGLAGTGNTAGAHIKNAVIHSTDYWYGVNKISTYEPTVAVIHPVKPTAAVIEAYAEKVRLKFEAALTVEDKMEILMQQKYIHFNLPGSYELFAELRRTRHPKLEPFTFNGRVMKPVAERIRYPLEEFKYNTENYLKVKAQDNMTTPIFWVPAGKRGEAYYRNDYNY